MNEANLTDLLRLRLAALSDSVEDREWEQAVAQCESLLRRLKEAHAESTRCAHRWQVRRSSWDLTLYRCAACGEEHLT